MSALPFTGERFVPGVAGEIWYEHWHRYHFAVPLVAGKVVLDVACGAGYGSALLARQARSVHGVDISAQALAHATATYAGAAGNLQFVAADCGSLPFGDGSFDVVVSFETIEHIAGQERFLDEIARVLRPAGVLVLSSPNRPEYSGVHGTANPFHVRELDRDELAALLAPRFPHAAWLGQHVSFFSVLAPEARPADGEILEVQERAPLAARTGRARPLYYVVLAGRDAATIAALPHRLSVLADADDWVKRDYGKVTRQLHAAHERGNALEREVASLQVHHDEAVRQRDRLRADHDEAVRQRDRLRADHDEAVRQRDAAVAALEASKSSREAGRPGPGADGPSTLHAHGRRAGKWRASLWRLLALRRR